MIHKFIIAVFMLSTLAFSEVVDGTLYRSDAQAVENFMEANGVYDGRIKIVIVEGLVVYAVEFPGEYYNWESDTDVNRVASVFGAVGYVSEETSWHSDFAICLFEENTYTLSTENCREIKRMIDAGYSGAAMARFAMDNMLMGYRSEADLMFDFSDTITSRNKPY